MSLGKCMAAKTTAGAQAEGSVSDSYAGTTVFPSRDARAEIPHEIRDGVAHGLSCRNSWIRETYYAQGTPRRGGTQANTRSKAAIGDGESITSPT